MIWNGRLLLCRIITVGNSFSRSSWWNGCWQIGRHWRASSRIIFSCYPCGGVGDLSISLVCPIACFDWWVIWIVSLVVGGVFSVRYHYEEVNISITFVNFFLQVYTIQLVNPAQIIHLFFFLRLLLMYIDVSVLTMDFPGLPFLPSLLVNQLFCGWSIWTLERFLAVFSWALQGRKNYFYLSLFVFLLDGVEHLGLRYFLLSLVIILGRNNWVSFFLFIVYCWLKHETTKNVASLEIWIAKFVVFSQLVFIMTFMFGLFWGVNDK